MDSTREITQPHYVIDSKRRATDLIVPYLNNDRTQHYGDEGKNTF